MITHSLIAGRRGRHNDTGTPAQASLPLAGLDFVLFGGVVASYDCAGGLRGTEIDRLVRHAGRHEEKFARLDLMADGAASAAG